MKSKYRPELDKVVYDAICVSGSDSHAWEMLGVNEATFYRWASTHKTFREAIAEARDFHRKTAPEIQKMMLLRYIISVLEAGHHVVTYRTKTTSRSIRKDSRKRIIFTDETESCIEHTEFKPIQKWVADKVLPNAGDLEDAIKKVLNAGLRVSDPTLAPASAIGRTMTEEDLLALDAIKENLLFGVQN